MPAQLVTMVDIVYAFTSRTVLTEHLVIFWSTVYRLEEGPPRKKGKVHLVGSIVGEACGKN